MKKLIILIIMLLFAYGCDEANSEIVTGNEEVYLLANGEAIGLILDYNISIEIEFNPYFEPVNVWANGKIRYEGLALSDIIYFSEPDCKGDAYLMVDFNELDMTMPFTLKRIKGRIRACEAPECESTLYYLPPNEEFYWNIAPVSYSSNGLCSNFMYPTERNCYKLLPNDPAVTGIREYPFPLPLTFSGMEQLKLKLAN